MIVRWADVDFVDNPGTYWCGGARLQIEPEHIAAWKQLPGRRQLPSCSRFRLRTRLGRLASRALVRAQEAPQRRNATATPNVSATYPASVVPSDGRYNTNAPTSELG